MKRLQGQPRLMGTRIKVDDLYLNRITDIHIARNVAHIAIGNFRDMNQSAGMRIQSNKGTIRLNPCHFSFHNLTDLIHIRLRPLPRLILSRLYKPMLKCLEEYGGIYES